MKKNLLTILCVCVLSLLMTSCYSSRVYSGNLTPQDPTVKVNRHNNAIFLFGLIPTEKAQTQEAKNFVGEENNDFMARSYMSFTDGLLAAITFGIYTPTTTDYYLPMNTKK